MRILILFFILVSLSCHPENKPKEKEVNIIPLDLEMANKLSRLAFNCIDQEYPNKLGQVIGGPEDLLSPRILRPAFYGCFDWHSAVHGHWTFVTLLKKFPGLDSTQAIRNKISSNINPENIQTEIQFWEGPHNKSFERTYGWAWLLKLQETLDTWDDPDATNWASALQPLTDMLVDKYKEFLPKLNYPIRVGEHSNTAFGLGYALDYATTGNQIDLLSVLVEKAKVYYMSDKNCPISWEPSGYDFLSPCLEEARVMSKILDQKGFTSWWNHFVEQEEISDLLPATSLDLTDGKLVHLVGLNLSRAWCLLEISKKLGDPSLNTIAEKHLNASIDQVVNGDYAGEHWLASFAVMAMMSR